MLQRHDCLIGMPKLACRYHEGCTTAPVAHEEHTINIFSNKICKYHSECLPCAVYCVSGLLANTTLLYGARQYTSNVVM